MNYATLGDTGIAVSRLCFGTLTMGPLQRNLPLAEGVGLLESAFSLGVNFLDTAELYGTYPYIREALTIKPDAVVCTKSYSYDKKTAEDSFRAAVEGIGREYIDIYMLHEQESRHTIRGHQEAVQYFLRRKEEGLFGALGLSTHFIAGVEGALSYPDMQVIFPLINRAGVGICDGTAAEMMAAIQRAKALGRGILAMKPLGGGHLIGERAAALSYILNAPAVDSIAIGIQNQAELRYNCAVFSGQEPDPKWTEQLRSQRRELIVQDWCEGCGRCVARCKNKALRLAHNKAVVDQSRCALCGYCGKVCPQFCIKVI